MSAQEMEQFETMNLDDLPEPMPVSPASDRAAVPDAGAQGGVLKIDTVLQIPVVLQVVVGSTTLPVADLLNLGRGAVIPLDSRVGDPVGVMINGREIARGEVVVIEDDNTRFGVSLTEIRDPHLGALQQ
jgi:flagellar motor switch protein FliN